MLLKILYIAPSTGYGGAESFLINTARYHDPGRVAPVYACFRDGALLSSLRSHHKSVYLAGFSIRLRNPIAWLRCICWLRKIIREEKIDLVHSTLAYGAIFGSLASFFSKKPHVWFQHGPVTGWQDRLAGILPNILIFSNSEHTTKAQLLLSPSAQFKLISPGVDQEKIRLAIATKVNNRSQRDASLVLGMLCRPQEQKGIELFIEALAELRKKNIDAVGIVVGGSSVPDAYELSLQNLAKDRQVPIEWISYRNNPWEVLNACDGMVCASIEPEGFGLSLAEAMALGIVPIAPREGGPLDLIEDKVTGIFFTPRDFRSLAEQLALLATNRQLLNSIGGAARSHAEKSLMAKSSILSLENAYTAILAGGAKC